MLKLALGFFVGSFGVPATAFFILDYFSLIN